MKKQLSVILSMVFLTGVLSMQANAGTSANEAYIGDLKWVAFNFAPRGWAQCDGQLMSINQNSALFSLLGTTYGGDGRTTFGLPDLRGRNMVHQGTGPGLTTRQLGQKSGVETVALSVNYLPWHRHALFGSTSTADQLGAANNAYATPARSRIYAAAPNTLMDAASIANSGNSQPHENMAPTNTLNCIIALVGLYPTRN